MTRKDQKRGVWEYGAKGRKWKEGRKEKGTVDTEGEGGEVVGVLSIGLEAAGSVVYGKGVCR